jgi:hypothetical protein
MYMVFDNINNDGYGDGYQAYYSRGTRASRSAVQAGDIVTGLSAHAYDGANQQPVSGIIFGVDAGGTVSSGIVPGYINFDTTNSSGTSKVRVSIDRNGLTSFQNTTGFGYATAGNGDGGTVTQGTSRTTAVTLNKICGQITLFTTTGSTTAASFTVNNSLVAANDVVVAAQKSGTNNYEICVSRVSAGSFQITFRSTSGTSSDAPVFTFAVIKAVAS